MSSEPASGHTISTYLSACSSRVERVLEGILPSEHVAPERLHRAMRYSVFAGGKRLRPALVQAACTLARCESHLDASVIDQRCAMAMAAVELLHTYTLVHDDLPAMDDDDLRRGRPTCHKAFDEATAILVGDALQCLAFEVIAGLDAEAVRILARASGSLGVVGGQQEDIDATAAHPLPVTAGAAQTAPADDALLHARLERMHVGKTAALIRASCELGARAAGAQRATLEMLSAFGTAIGLAFQVADDVLDATASTATLGKTAGKDAAQHKLTYVSVYGLARAQSTAARLEVQALAILPPAFAADELRALGQFMVRRDR